MTTPRPVEGTMDMDVNVDTAVMGGIWKRHLERSGDYTRFYSVDSFVFERGGFMRTALPDKPTLEALYTGSCTKQAFETIASWQIMIDSRYLDLGYRSDDCLDTTTRLLDALLILLIGGSNMVSQYHGR